MSVTQALLGLLLDMALLAVLATVIRLKVSRAKLHE